MKLKKSSVDIQNHIPMCESMIKVIDFDKIPKDYSRGRGWPGGKKHYLKLISLKNIYSMKLIHIRRVSLKKTLSIQWNWKKKKPNKNYRTFHVSARPGIFIFTPHFPPALLST